LGESSWWKQNTAQQDVYQREGNQAIKLKSEVEQTYKSPSSVHENKSSHYAQKYRTHTHSKRAEERAPQRLLSKRRISSLVNKSCSFIKFHRQPVGSGTTECNALVGAVKLFQFAAAFREQEAARSGIARNQRAFFQSTDRAVNICCSATPWQRA
jgi:hypothetical protein